MADKRFRPDRECDPIAELARLIAQSDTHGESGPAGDRFREAAVSDGYDAPPELPPAPQLPVDLSELQQAFERDEHRPDDQAHDIDDLPYAAKAGYRNGVPRVRRRSLTLLLAICGIALIGPAWEFGYRNMFGGAALTTVEAINEPNRIAPAPSQPQAEGSGNARQAGATITGSVDNMVSREAQPTTTVGPPKTAPRGSSSRAISPPIAAGQALVNQPTPPDALATDPSGSHSTVDAASQRAEKSSAVEVTAALNPEHLAGAPIAATANSTAAITPPALGGGYAVQVTSGRSENRAHTAFRSLQAKYPNQLNGREPIIRRADLGAAGIYYRALVGPFASVEKAAKLCNGLKAAGGDCIIQKN
jgi:SPOR domain